MSKIKEDVFEQAIMLNIIRKSKFINKVQMHDDI